ncbi:MAG: saccharopine dehydrogenase NADP-binding domain-containing protein [Pseudomonadota bacterium]
MTATILILGGYGVFGGRLAARLLRETSHEIVVAGRTMPKAQVFCKEYGGTPLQVDRDDTDAMTAAFASIRPDIVVDASGPFEFDGTAHSHRVVESALHAGAHYFDLADNADFVANVSMMDAQAHSVGKAVLSGVSSVPCLSSAAVDALVEGLADVESIDMAIIPGNRAPRGRAVIESILSQAGKPFAQYEDGDWQARRCWSSLRTATLELPGCAPIKNRLISPIEVPDQRLFPKQYQAQSVLFFAGLELRTLHLGLWAATALVHLKLLRSLRRLTSIAHTVATWFEGFGSDRGGMYVEVKGTQTNGEIVKRRWTLIAEEGDGPQVPATPARALIDMLLSGEVCAGARPAIGVIPLAGIEKHFAAFAIKTGIEEVPLQLADDHAARGVSGTKRANDAGIAAV